MRTRCRVPRILRHKRSSNDATSDRVQKEKYQRGSPKTEKNALAPVIKYVYVKPFAQMSKELSLPTLNVADDSPKKSQAPKSKKRVRRETHKCDSCDESFNDRSSLIIHKTEKSIVRTREALREPPLKLTCEMCNRQFLSKGMLTRHHRNCGVMNSNDKPIKSNRRRNPTKPTKNKENETAEEGSTSCQKCGKVFKKDKYLKVHLTMAHGEHIVCQFCDKKFDTVALLKSHVSDVHSGEYTEFCPICNKGFFSRQSLKVHMTAHARDGKLNYCDICGKGFRHKVYLEKHVQQVHVEMQDHKKYQCGVCAYETQYKTVFREHMYKHTGEDQVPCDVCGKRMRRSYMKIHLRIHSGYKPEICEFCGKAFTARKYLTKHRVVHTGEKPYQCRVCDKRYTQRGTLTLHMKRKHQQSDVENSEEVVEGEEEEVDQEILDQFVEVSEDGAVVEVAREDDPMEDNQTIGDQINVGECDEEELVKNTIVASEEVVASGDEVENKIVYAPDIYEMPHESEELKNSKDIIIYEVTNSADVNSNEAIKVEIEEEIVEEVIINDKEDIKVENSDVEDESDGIYEVHGHENDSDEEIEDIEDEKNRTKVLNWKC